MSLDRGTKIYAGILGGILLLGLIAWLMSLDFRIGEINDTLSSDPQISAYPYPFHVMQIVGTTAYVSTPRTNAVPAITFLGMIKPALSTKSDQDPAVIAAQKELGAIQGKVRKLILERDDIEKVSWRIDKEWFAAKGVWLN
ncbi:MAG: hypothetical protein ABW076_00305 [Candidatus Thiodiazotropha sp.]